MNMEFQKLILTNETTFSSDNIDLYLNYIISQKEPFSCYDFSDEFGIDYSEGYNFLSYAVTYSLLDIIYKLKCNLCDNLLDETFDNYNDIDITSYDKIICQECCNKYSESSILQMIKCGFVYKSDIFILYKPTSFRAGGEL